jgi:hypothetical protein
VASLASRSAPLTASFSRSASKSRPRTSSIHTIYYVISRRSLASRPIACACHVSLPAHRWSTSKCSLAMYAPAWRAGCMGAATTARACATTGGKRAPTVLVATVCVRSSCAMPTASRVWAQRLAVLRVPAAATSCCCCQTRRAGRSARTATRPIRRACAFLALRRASSAAGRVPTSAPAAARTGQQHICTVARACEVAPSVRTRMLIELATLVTRRANHARVHARLNAFRVHPTRVRRARVQHTCLPLSIAPRVSRAAPMGGIPTPTVCASRAVRRAVCATGHRQRSVSTRRRVHLSATPTAKLAPFGVVGAACFLATVLTASLGLALRHRGQASVCRAATSIAVYATPLTVRHASRANRRGFGPFSSSKLCLACWADEARVMRLAALVSSITPTRRACAATPAARRATGLTQVLASPVRPARPSGNADSA